MIARAGLIAAATLLAAASTPPRLTADGYAGARIGDTRATVMRRLGLVAHPRAVGGPDPAVCDEYHPRRAPAGLIVMLEDGRLSRVSATRADVFSARGIQVGDPEAKVRAAYRGVRLVDEPHKYVDAPARYLTYMMRGRGIRYEIDAKRRVSAIHAGGAAINYVEGCL